jgi:hypothetical protein
LPPPAPPWCRSASSGWSKGPDQRSAGQTFSCSNGAAVLRGMRRGGASVPKLSISSRVGVNCSDPCPSPALILRPANLDRPSISVIGCRRPFARTAAHGALRPRVCWRLRRKAHRPDVRQGKLKASPSHNCVAHPVRANRHFNSCVYLVPLLQYDLPLLACPVRIAAADIVSQ